MSCGRRRNRTDKELIDVCVAHLFGQRRAAIEQALRSLFERACARFDIGQGFGMGFPAKAFGLEAEKFHRRTGRGSYPACIRDGASGYERAEKAPRCNSFN